MCKFLRKGRANREQPWASGVPGYSSSSSGSAMRRPTDESLEHEDLDTILNKHAVFCLGFWYREYERYAPLFWLLDTITREELALLHVASGGIVTRSADAAEAIVRLEHSADVYASGCRRERRRLERNRLYGQRQHILDAAAVSAAWCTDPASPAWLVDSIVEALYNLSIRTRMCTLWQVFLYEVSIYARALVRSAEEKSRRFRYRNNLSLEVANVHNAEAHDSLKVWVA